MAIVLALIIVVALGWLAFDRWGKQPGIDAAGARETARRTVQQINVSSHDLVGKVRGRFDRSAGDEAFKSWIASLAEGVPGAGEAPAAFSAWLDALSPAELRSFRGKLSSFCDTLDIEAGWLHNGQLGDRPELRRTLEETVGLFALAYARGAEQRGDIERARAFQRWMAAPNRLDNRGFGAKLYAALVAAEMVAPPAELLLAPERQRRAFANQAIREAAARDPQAFDAVLATVIHPATAKQPDQPAKQMVVESVPQPILAALVEAEVEPAAQGAQL